MNNNQETNQGANMITLEQIQILSPRLVEEIYENLVEQFEAADEAFRSPHSAADHASVTRNYRVAIEVLQAAEDLI
jgi:hypothetical protein